MIKVRLTVYVGYLIVMYSTERENMKASYYLGLLMACLMVFPVHAQQDDWIVGKWELVFDPDGGKKDFVEFRQNGDAYSHGPLGSIEGLYLVNPQSVKAVFTYEEKDVIMTFHFNEARDELRIVTSHTGRESIYKKMSMQK